MDRVTAYPGALIAETDPLRAQQNAMIALGWAAQSTFGTATCVDGFALTPTTPASLVLNLAPGVVWQIEPLEATVWSSLPANSASLVKQGLMLAIDPITFTPPATTGYSQAFLIEVQYADLDTNPVLLPYYNATNPAQPYSGPGGSGASQNTARLGIAAIQVKAGVAVSGSPTIPSPDVGWSGLYVVTLASGQTTITSGNISIYSGAPFIPVKLPQVPAAIQAQIGNYAADTGAANAMVLTLPSYTPGALPDGTPIRFKKGGNPNTGATSITINGTAYPIQTSSGNALTGGELVGGGSASGVILGGALRLGGTLGNTPIYVAGPILHVSPTGTDATADGTAAKPFRTISAAAYYGASRFILAGGTLTIQLDATGTYDPPGTIPPVVGTLLIQGDPNNPGGYVLAGPGSAGTGLIFPLGGAVNLNGLTLNNTGTVCHTVNSAAQMTCTNVVFTSPTPTNFAHVQAAAGGRISLSGCTFASGMTFMAAATSGGNVSFSGNCAVTNNPAWGNSCVQASDRGGIQVSPGVSITGAATGVRFTSILNAVINTFGQGPNVFPGSSAGGTATGGQSV